MITNQESKLCQLLLLVSIMGGYFHTKFLA